MSPLSRKIRDFSWFLYVLYTLVYNTVKLKEFEKNYKLKILYLEGR